MTGLAERGGEMPPPALTARPDVALLEIETLPVGG
jgi:hypothetical protein